MSANLPMSEPDELAARMSRLRRLIEKLDHALKDSAHQRKAVSRLRAEADALSRLFESGRSNQD